MIQKTAFCLCILGNFLLFVYAPETPKHKTPYPGPFRGLHCNCAQQFKMDGVLSFYRWDFGFSVAVAQISDHWPGIGTG